MATRIYVSHSVSGDQVVALRLQTLASIRQGLQVHVPPASTRSQRGIPTSADLRALSESHIVVANVSSAIPPAMVRELELAQKLGKPILPIALKGRAPVAWPVPARPVI